MGSIALDPGHEYLDFAYKRLNRRVRETSPQLHQAQRIGRTPAQGRLPEICQSLTARIG
jgi:hypothetical protein